MFVQVDANAVETENYTHIKLPQPYNFVLPADHIILTDLCNALKHSTVWMVSSVTEATELDVVIHN